MNDNVRRNQIAAILSRTLNRDRSLVLVKHESRDKREDADANEQPRSAKPAEVEVANES